MSSPVEGEVFDQDPDPRANERFHAYPKERIEAVATISGTVGVVAGFYQGIKLASLRYLTENGHRLPRTVGGWYFYHKKKNYIMIIAGTKEAGKLSLKYSVGLSGFFGLEHAIDKYLRRGTIDFMNTTLAATMSSFSYATLQQLSRVQSRNLVLKGSFLGLCLGLSQDFLITKRGGYIWYLDRLNLLQEPQKRPSNVSI